MNQQQAKQEQKARRARRTRSRIMGTAARPRLSVNRSLAHMSAQLINDMTGVTLCAADDRGLTGTKTVKASEVGKRIAAAAKAKQITAVVFDRGSFLYHGRVKSLADAAREAGLEF